MSTLISIILIILLCVLNPAYGYHMSLRAECHFKRDMKDLELIRTYNFNKFEFIRYNSTLGKYVGFNTVGQQNAEAWNNNPAQLQQMKVELDRYCRNNAGNEISAITEKSVPPQVHVRSVKKGTGVHPTVLMCSAYGFYPKLIKLTWLSDGQPLTSDVTSTEELADGDWYYQIHSRLDYIPKSGEKISCVVEHASFSRPMTFELGPSVSESDTNKIAIGASGLVLGVILAAAGLIYYKKKSTGRILVPH
ncbi:DLA class II histocompatibility antigen, DR-1 beta chain-like [Chanos chanos]|uniref:DLA class II histocompatibility antigen, DR-1 beta chain-like n=1 Tax=Chanos chanos TaxID=29144 RepID=A0A6J2WG17_CHACN|nr:DLA class II histocompatibility antigen, DR-1 beta chain-like [Chanos chanos]